MNPVWWTYPFKPVRVDPGIFDRIDCSQYTAEVKLDGWRSLLIVSERKTELWTRQKSLIRIPDELSQSINSLSLPVGTVLDGEIWNPKKRGGWENCESLGCRVAFWDVLRVGNKDVRQKPIEERREILRSLFQPNDLLSIVEPKEASRNIFEESLQLAREIRGQARSGFIHGLVLKRTKSPRRDNNIRCVEHPDWLKIVFDGMQSGSV